MKFRKENYKIMLGWLSKKVQNPILKFIFLWITLNHWYKTFYEKSINRLSDQKCIDKIKKDYQIYHRLFNNQNLDPQLEKNLVNVSSAANALIFQFIPELLFDGFHFDQSQKNYETLIDLVYELRNKIFHGDISIDNTKIRRLAGSLNVFLEYFIGAIILNPRITR